MKYFLVNIGIVKNGSEHIKEAFFETVYDHDQLKMHALHDSASYTQSDNVKAGDTTDCVIDSNGLTHTIKSVYEFTAQCAKLDGNSIVALLPGMPQDFLDMPAINEVEGLQPFFVDIAWDTKQGVINITNIVWAADSDSAKREAVLLECDEVVRELARQSSNINDLKASSASGHFTALSAEPMRVVNVDFDSYRLNAYVLAGELDYAKYINITPSIACRNSPHQAR